MTRTCALVATAALLLAGCAVVAPDAGPTTTRTPASVAPPGTPSATPSATPSTDPLQPPMPVETTAGSFELQASVAEVTAADMTLIRDLVVLALEPTQEAAGRLPFSPAGVRLGLAQNLLSDLDLSQAGTPAAWEIDLPGFRGWVGPFSALQVLRARVQGTDRDPSLPDGGRFQVVLGKHPHCASPAVPAPEGLEQARRLSVQPTDQAIESCLDWFTVDVFLDPDGSVVAITLDLWEP